MYTHANFEMFSMDLYEFFIESLKNSTPNLRFICLMFSGDPFTSAESDFLQFLQYDLIDMFFFQDGLNTQTNEHFDQLEEKLDNDIEMLNNVIELTKSELNSKIDRFKNSADVKIDELDSKIETTHNLTLQIISELPPISNIVSYVVNVSIFHIFL